MTAYEQSENFSQVCILRWLHVNCLKISPRSAYSYDCIWTIWKFLPGLYTHMTTYEPSENFSQVCRLRWLHMNILKISPRSVDSDDFIWTVWKFLPSLHTQITTYEQSENFSQVCILRFIFFSQNSSWIELKWLRKFRTFKKFLSSKCSCMVCF
jgi:hypothetical protein